VWSDLLAAVALLLVFEGMLPFLNPAAVKRALAQMMQMGERELRIAGFISMMAGVVLLLVVRS
jgi:uncharacterized protein